MKHSDLIIRAERWLRNTRHCSAILTELVSRAGEIPDAIGWRDGHESILIECKTSKSDFLADANKVWRRLDCIGMGEYRFFMCPPGVIKATDLPSRWGLLWVEANRVCVVRESEVFERSWQNEMCLLVSAIRRQERPSKKALVAQDDYSLTLNTNPKETNTMPTASPTKPIPVCPEGEDINLILKAVTETTNPPDAKFSPGATQWRWEFETTELVDEMWEEPYKLALYTGTEYGGERAKLTKLLDKICRDLSREEKETLDTDTLVGKKFRGDVTHAAKATGGVRAVLENVRRISKPKPAASTDGEDAAPASKAVAPKATAKPAPKPAETEEQEEDPFSDE